MFVSAGEPSADAHAAAVVHTLLDSYPELVVEGIGGPCMAAAGAAVRNRMEEFSVIGFAEALGKIPGHFRYLQQIKREFAAGRYDLAILVDYPGLHLRVAKAATTSGVPVLYYIAPQLWAWGEQRVGILRRSVDHLAVILPFEESFFAARGIPTSFVGHPLLDRPRGPDRQRARAKVGIPIDAPALGLFPGSRDAEIRRMWPLLRDAARAVRKSVPELEVLLAGVPGRVYAGAGEFRIVAGDSALVMAAADAALVKSGTATLEAAIADTPLVITYRAHPVSYAVARRMVQCQHIGLVNLVAGCRVAPEFVQRMATPRALADAVLRLLDSEGRPARAQRASLLHVRDKLGGPGAARRTARIGLELMRCT